MGYEINLGKNGEVVLKPSGSREIATSQKSPRLPLEEDKSLNINYLNRWVVTSLGGEEKLESVKYNFSTLGSLTIFLNFFNGSQAILINTFRAKSLDASVVRKSIKPAINKKSSPEQAELKSNVEKILIKISEIFIQSTTEHSSNSLKESRSHSETEKPIESLMTLDPSQEVNALEPDTEKPSKINQATVKLNILKLKQAKSCNAELSIELLEHFEQFADNFSNKPPKTTVSEPSKRIANLKISLFKAKYNEGIRFLNNVIELEILPPLDFMSIIIKKFGHSRFGSDDELLEVFNKVKEAYLDNPNESTDSKNIFVGAFMLATLSRHSNKREISPVLESQLKDLFELYPNVHTLNVLLTMYLDANRNDEATRLFEKYSFPFVTRTHVLKLQYYSQNDGVEAAISYFRKVPIEAQNASMCQNILKIIAVKKHKIPDALQFYKNNFTEQMKKNERVLETLISLHMRNRDCIRAWKTFEKIKFPQEQTFGKMIEMLIDKKMFILATSLYNLAVNRGFYQTVQPNFGHTIKIDFHNFQVKQGGTPEYRTYSKAEIGVILRSFYLKMFEQWKSNTLTLPVTIYFICGKGLGVTRQFVLESLKHFKWTGMVDPKNSGQILLQLEEFEEINMLDFIEPENHNDSSLNKLASMINAYFLKESSTPMQRL